MQTEMLSLQLVAVLSLEGLISKLSKWIIKVLRFLTARLENIKVIGLTPKTITGSSSEAT